MFTLDETIFLYILELFVDSEIEQSCRDGHHSSQSLKTLRAVSQVCRKWRACSLSWSALWAKSLDLNFNTVPNYYWIKELLRRSNDCPLWVSIKLSNIHPLKLPQSLESSWTRVHAISIKAPNDIKVAKTSRDLDKLLYREAPNLQRIGISLDAWSLPSTDRKFMGKSINLKQYMPNLRHFSSSLFVFGIEAFVPLQELRTLRTNVDADDADYAVESIALPNLERLALTTLRTGPPQENSDTFFHVPRPKDVFLHLPRLQEVVIDASKDGKPISLGLDFLGLLSPTVGYPLKIIFGKHSSIEDFKALLALPVFKDRISSRRGIDRRLAETKLVLPNHIASHEDANLGRLVEEFEWLVVQCGDETPSSYDSYHFYDEDTSSS
ncbi:hypothetical protein D9613_003613 [Agrocybe pediades]|uniref:F-box domain-containing protein n=1 Tax=Agrocybe pediades TaxID=84607 RepID=A0A8H4VII1_9AGAR|nr:hypothetical protein D9613_003613 [Agrocybe pediades]